MPLILVVEDDPQIRSSLQSGLRAVGYSTQEASDGTAALSAVLRDRPDLVLLDLGLPDVEGSTLLAMIRSITDTPVIAVTARTEPEEIIRVLNLGADDYVTKPFDVDQLDARIRAVVRRTTRQLKADDNRDRLVVGDLVLLPSGRECILDGERLDLRHLEFELLLTLALADGQLVPTEGLIRRLWGDDVKIDDGTNRLDVLLSVLRRKLGESGSQPRYLHRVRGRGLRLSAHGAH